MGTSLLTSKRAASDNYSRLSPEFPRMEWGGETGSHGDQGKDRRVPVAGHHWKPPPKVDSSYARAQVYMVKGRVSLPPGFFWRNERTIEKENREQWEHLSMAYFYVCSQEAISVTTLHPKREPRTESVYHQCSWVHKLVNLLYRKLTYFRNTIISQLEIWTED